jgi:ATP/maltotriose-dependent transcriptional regulator MalT/DNA-binding SARP family transcriptional activator
LYFTGIGLSIAHLFFLAAPGFQPSLQNMTVTPRQKRPPAKKDQRAIPRPRIAPPALAKISPPLLTNVCERKRLFKILDNANRRPVSFFTAPAGAGKTTLAVSYLKARQRPSLWLQLEAGNADPASFVYYLRLAAQRLAPRRATKLPLLTPEYQLGLPAFAKHLFETLARVLPGDAVLVLDNYQEVGADAALHGFLAEGITALPPGMHLLCLSRDAPPSALARRRAEGALAILDWDTLRFTLEETEAMAKLQCGKHAAPSSAELQQLHARTQGWAAGLMLLLETHDSMATASPRMEQGDQTTFDYLASEVFRRLEPAACELLPPLAIPPALSTAMAAELTGNPHAGKLLEDLVRANCFTTRHASGHYQFHPLFRNFLLNELRRNTTEADQQRFHRAAANLLVDEGQSDEAALLFIAIADWTGLSVLIIRSAQGLLDQGRHNTLATWLQALPAERREADPWLLFYFGAARMPFDLDESRLLFEQATESFSDAGNDISGFVLAWSGIIQAIAMGWSDSTLLGRWIVLAEQKLVPRLAQLPPELQGRVILGMFLALQFHQPQHPDMRLWAERLEAMVSHCPGPNDRIQMGAFLLLYYVIWSGDLHSAERLVHALRPERLDLLTAAVRIHWHIWHAVWLWQCNANDAALGEIESAMAMAEKTGVRIWDFVIHTDGVYASMNVQDTEAAAHSLEQAAHLTSPHRPLELAHNQLLRAWLERVRGNSVAARRYSEWAISLTRAKGSAFELSAAHIELAHSLRQCGEYTKALAHAEQALVLTRAYHGQWMEYLARACLAETAFASGDVTRGLEALREAYPIARENGYRSLMWQDPKGMALLCNHALEVNIEPEHCRELITAHRLAPPDSSRFNDYWPFPIKINTLGCFQLLKDGQPLRFAGKPPRKPLELLKVLIALGGRDLRDDRLSTILWPDAAGDSAQSAFTTTLARLRKLLGSDDSIVVQDGRVSLNPDHCWLDTWALEARIATVECAPVAVGAAAPVLDLYRGAFLEHESDAAWVLPARERLRSRFLRFLTQEARRLGAAGHPEQAITLFLQGLEIDPLIEDFYLGLMTALGELGRKAEALISFERCSVLLAKTLGVQPGTEICALAERLRQS